MSTIQVSKSIKKSVAKEIQDYVMSNYPNVIMLEDVPLNLQVKWEKTCNHEMFYQDVNRLIGDIYEVCNRNMRW